MPNRYNLRNRDKDVKWIEDESLREEESEEESEYESEGDDSMEEQTITIPISRYGIVKIEIDNRYGDIMEEEEDEEEEEDATELMEQVAKRMKTKAGKKNGEGAALDLNDAEQTYFRELPKPDQKKLNKHMKQLSALVSSNGIPNKFRVLELPVADGVKATVIKKINMLNEMDPDTGEVYKLRTWVEGFLRIPFGVQVDLPVKLDDGAKPCADFLAETRTTLDKAVYGMNGAKTQIMQILAQWISNPSSVGNVIALKGPMGVGKTSFAKHGIAGALKRPFEFFSLGGATDSANFVGHSYTYEGSMWGRIADSVMVANCMNPVMYFDELDKVSTTPQGEEIVSMLIHLTDRSQNSQFHDRYFAGVDIDLSQCLFVFSFNDESKVHPILKDRMQVIQCSGYTVDEKTIILTQYVWPQVIDRIKMDGLTIEDSALKFLITEYSADEEGVRTLIRAVETLVTRLNLLRIADEDTAKTYPFYMKVALPLKIDVSTVKHVLKDLVPQQNESWRALYT
jgi:ATP-dependent Lon protease